MEPNTRPIPELVAERKALAQQLADLNRRLEKLDSELFARLETALTAFGMWSASQTTPQPATPPPLAPILAPPPPRPPAKTVEPMLFTSEKPQSARQGEIGSLIMNYVWQFLAQHQRPLKTSEIYELLMKEGVEIPGKDPRNNLSAHLSRSRSLTRRGNGWWKAPEKQEPPEGGS